MPTVAHSFRTTARRFKRRYWELREKLSAVDFDGDFYVAAYEDVRDSVRKGQCTPFQHYILFGRNEARHPKYIPGDPALLAAALQPPTTSIVFLELTSRCNLRCVYCAVSQPTYQGIDLPLENLDNFVYQMKIRGVQVVSMNGHGESTIVKNWESYADRLLDAGFRLHMTTNFAKRLNDAEVGALSRFEMILVSLDTVDGELLASLRRGARIEQILENIKRVFDFANLRSRHPDIAISCVVSDLSAPFVDETVRVLLELGVKTFRFGDLSEYAPIPGVLRARHVTNITPEMLPVAREEFRKAIERIETAGAHHFVDAPLAAFLLHDEMLTVSDRTAPAGEKNIHATKVETRQTRDCLDPWNTAFVQADAKVRPCCFFEETLGSVATDTLSQVVSNEAFKELRRELLTGELRPNCQSCASRPVIDREAFENKVRRYISSEKSRLETLDLRIEP